MTKLHWKAFIGGSGENQEKGQGSYKARVEIVGSETRLQEFVV